MLCSGAREKKEPFRRFRTQYKDFNTVENWILSQKVILLIDELNVIPPSTPGYEAMSEFLDSLVGRKGSALVYSTHLRDTSDLLRQRERIDGSLSTRKHAWLPIPRLVNENCLHGLERQATVQPSFWSAVLRGRLPALMLQDQEDIVDYGQSHIFPVGTSVEERAQALASVITGKIDTLPSSRGLFRAYSYMSERFKGSSDFSDKQLFAWPPFLVAQPVVLGKSCGSLRTSLEDPNIEESKAFEALVELAILVRLLSGEHHSLVPHHPSIPPMGSYSATEVLHVKTSARTISEIIKEVKAHFRDRRGVLQVVAVPYYAAYPIYDFFLLHRNGSGWEVAAGYQCKQGTERPSDDVLPEVPLSVWIEGKCRKYRVDQYGQRGSIQKVRGWTLLGESAQADLLGVSVSEALPVHAETSAQPTGQLHNCCQAEMAYNDSHNHSTDASSDDGSPDSKKAKTETGSS